MWVTMWVDLWGSNCGGSWFRVWLSSVVSDRAGKTGVREGLDRAGYLVPLESLSDPLATSVEALLAAPEPAPTGNFGDQLHA